MEEGKDVRWDKGRAHWSTGSAPNPHAIPPCGGGHRRAARWSAEHTLQPFNKRVRDISSGF